MSYVCRWTRISSNRQLYLCLFLLLSFLFTINIFVVLHYKWGEKLSLNATKFMEKDFVWGKLFPNALATQGVTFDEFSSDKFALKNDSILRYFNVDGKSLCLREGTRSVLNHTCVCKRHWSGVHCSFPSIAAESFQNGDVQVRFKPRRIICMIGFNHEFDLLETRFHETGDVVDVFIILESNYTNFGQPKKLLLLNKLREGFLRKWHDKIVYLFLDHFPEAGLEDGWVAEYHLRRYIGQQGMKRLTNVNDDDIIIFTDADEIPSKDAVLFIKLHDGYTEPFSLFLRWSIFGFYWKKDDSSIISSGCSVKMFKLIKCDINRLRTGIMSDDPRLTSLTENLQSLVNPWTLGSYRRYAGWHCSWCFPPNGIQIKLISAINADKPRWGDYPEKRNLTYIENLIRFGKWFDDTDLVEDKKITTPEYDDFYAPKYIVSDFQRFKYILANPYIRYSDDKFYFMANEKILNYFTKKLEPSYGDQ